MLLQVDYLHVIGDSILFGRSMINVKCNVDVICQNRSIQLVLHSRYVMT